VGAVAPAEEAVTESDGGVKNNLGLLLGEEFLVAAVGRNKSEGLSAGLKGRSGLNGLRRTAATSRPFRRLGLSLNRHGRFI
jgi:hypothetical protein